MKVDDEQIFFALMQAILGNTGCFRCAQPRLPDTEIAGNRGPVFAKCHHTGLQFTAAITWGKLPVSIRWNRCRIICLKDSFLNENQISAVREAGEIIFPAGIAGFLDIPANDFQLAP